MEHSGLPMVGRPNTQGLSSALASSKALRPHVCSGISNGNLSARFMVTTSPSQARALLSIGLKQP